MVTREAAGINGEIVTVSDVGRRVFSKLKLYTEINMLGYWPSVKAWLVEGDLWDAFTLAQNVAEGNEMFEQGIALFKARFGLTDEQVEELLSKCVDSEVA